jgi:hypothetical protein
VLSVDDGTPELRARDLAEREALAECGALEPVIDRRYRSSRSRRPNATSSKSTRKGTS